jgi:hypothetical protein
MLAFVMLARVLPAIFTFTWYGIGWYIYTTS